MKFVFYDEFKPGVLISEKVHDIGSLLKRKDASNPQEIVEEFVEAVEKQQIGAETMTTLVEELLLEGKIEGNRLIF